MKSVLLSAAAVAALVSAPANAQDVADSSFSGPRAEARIGWDRPVISASFDDGVDDLEDSVGKSGVTYGGEIGFDFDLQDAVVGVYAGLEGSSVKECSEIYGEDEACVRAGRNITVGGRVGAKLGTSSLVYAKGGYSNGDVRVDYEDFENLIDDFDISESVDGFHVGAGLEAGFGKRLYGKLEYVYTNYGGADYADSDFAIGADLERHQVVVGLGVRF